MLSGATLSTAAAELQTRLRAAIAAAGAASGNDSLLYL
jgi:hypothetical protein